MLLLLYVLYGIIVLSCYRMPPPCVAVAVAVARLRCLAVLRLFVYSLFFSNLKKPPFLGRFLWGLGIPSAFVFSCVFGLVFAVKRQNKRRYKPPFVG